MVEDENILRKNVPCDVYGRVPLPTAGIILQHRLNYVRESWPGQAGEQG